MALRMFEVLQQKGAEMHCKVITNQVWADAAQ